jgi:hypothetical protein
MFAEHGYHVWSFAGGKTLTFSEQAIPSNLDGFGQKIGITVRPMWMKLRLERNEKGKFQWAVLYIIHDGTGRQILPENSWLSLLIDGKEYLARPTEREVEALDRPDELNQRETVGYEMDESAYIALGQAQSVEYAVRSKIGGENTLIWGEFGSSTLANVRRFYSEHTNHESFQL